MRGVEDSKGGEGGEGVGFGEERFDVLLDL